MTAAWRETPTPKPVRDGHARLLSPGHHGDAQPGTPVYVRVADVDAVAREFDVAVPEQPAGRDAHLPDPGGNRLGIGTERG